MPGRRASCRGSCRVRTTRKVISLRRKQRSVETIGSDGWDSTLELHCVSEQKNYPSRKIVLPRSACRRVTVPVPGWRSSPLAVFASCTRAYIAQFFRSGAGIKYYNQATSTPRGQVEQRNPFFSSGRALPAFNSYNTLSFQNGCRRRSPLPRSPLL